MLGLAIRLAISVLLAVLVDVSGFADAADERLRTGYYALRGDRDTAQRVVLVALDAPTAAAWGAPPWRTDQLAPVLAAIARGGPAAVGFVDEPARWLAAGQRVPEGAIAGSAALDPGDRPIDAIPLRDAVGAPTAVAQLLAAAGRPATGYGVAINYLHRGQLSVVSAAEVARGAVPPAAFAGKVVVLGLTAQPYAGLVPTPVGALAPAEIHAHAAASVVDGVAWTRVPAALRWLLIALLASAALLLVHHLVFVGATLLTVGLVAGSLVLDYAMFTAASAWLGATLPISAILAASAIERIYERQAIRRHVTGIAQWTRQWAQLDTMRADVPEDEHAYWLRVGALARLYLGCSSTIVAELPPGGTELALRVVNGTTSSLIAERRRDVRGEPFDRAFETREPAWHDHFMADGKSSLLVPLAVRERCVGFWIVNFAARDVVGPAHVALIKTLAREIAVVVERRRGLGAIEGPALAHRILGPGQVSHELEEVRRAFDAHTQNQQELLALGESMPFGVLVATLWGEIRYVNTIGKALCKQEGLDPASPSIHLVDVLARLTGIHADEIHRYLRKFVQELEELHVHGRDRTARPGRDVVLSWVKPIAGDSVDAEQLVLVCALPRRAGERRAAGAARAQPRTPARTPVSGAPASIPPSGPLSVPPASIPPSGPSSIPPASVAATLPPGTPTEAALPSRPPEEEEELTIPVDKLDPAEAELGQGRSLGSLANAAAKERDLQRRTPHAPAATLQMRGARGNAQPAPGPGPDASDETAPFESAEAEPVAGANNGGAAPDAEPDDVTYVAAGESASSSRSLPVMSDPTPLPEPPAPGGATPPRRERTLPMFKVERDDTT